MTYSREGIFMGLCSARRRLARRGGWGASSIANDSAELCRQGQLLQAPIASVPHDALDIGYISEPGRCLHLNLRHWAAHAQQVRFVGLVGLAEGRHQFKLSPSVPSLRRNSNLVAYSLRAVMSDRQVGVTVVVVQVVAVFTWSVQPSAPLLPSR